MAAKRASLNVPVLFGLFLTGLGLGCDGYIRVKGTAYELIAPRTGPESEIYVDEHPPDLGQLRPLPNVVLTLLHGKDYAGVAPDSVTPRDDGLWQETARSDTSGAFLLGSVTSPRRFHAALRAEHPDYVSVTRVFVHDTTEHRAIVVLVRRDSAR